MKLRNEYLNSRATAFLYSPEAAAYAAGGNCDFKNYNILHDLGMSWQSKSVTNALTEASQRKLQQLIESPEQAVCAAFDKCECGKPHVEPTVLTFPVLIRKITYPGAQYYHLLPHKTNPILLIFWDRDGEWAEYRVGDPTKAPAWNYSVVVDLLEARKVAGSEVA